MSKSPIKILVVASDLQTSDKLMQILSNEGYTLNTAFNGVQALEALNRFNPDLMLLDVDVPPSGGLDLCRQLRANLRTRSLPILLLAEKDTSKDKIAGFEAGGDDYIIKPFCPNELSARIKAHLRITLLKQELELSEARYRNLIEQSPDALLLLSPKLELLFHNSRFVEILSGKTTEVLTGRTLTDLFPVSELFCEIAAIAQEASLKSTSIDRMVHLQTMDKHKIHLELRCSPIKDANDELAMLQCLQSFLCKKQ